MLFDLSGKRKRVVQVVYAALAVLFAVSFIGFGIGSDAAGGIFDALGLGSGDSTNDDPAFEAEIDDAEARIKADPKDETAYQDLVSVHFQAGNAASETDETTGAVTITSEAEQDYQASVAAWEDYVKITKKPDPGTAAIASNAYGSLLQAAEIQDAPPIAEDAVLPAQIAAEDNPGVGTYFTLAQYAYVGGDTKTGDEASKEAVGAADASQRKQVQQQLDAVAKASAQLQKQIEKQAEKGGGEEAFSNPLESGAGTGALGAGGLGGTPAPPAP